MVERDPTLKLTLLFPPELPPGLDPLWDPKDPPLHTKPLPCLEFCQNYSERESFTCEYLLLHQ